MELRDVILRETFGYTSFRPGQRQLIDAILSGRDAFGVLPTGAGKSLCYQLPSIILPGITLVLSPLISLMNDQVRALHARGISACCIHSAMSAHDYVSCVQLISSGRCKLIYAAPERLENANFLHMISNLPISMVVVDEAHCISQWGHDFRPSYRRIPQFIDSLPKRPIIAAFTATATYRVRQDITECLHLRAPERVVNSFDRSNLYFDVINTANKDTALLRLISQNTFPGIVYCATRKAAEQTATLLNENGISALAYHAGLRPELRYNAQNAFVHDRVSVLCATNAFGMGIDKPNVRFVIHYQMPGSLENYYQEAGRAGRDGQPSKCQIIFSEKDIDLQEFLIMRDPENPALSDEEVSALQDEGMRKLHAMKQYTLSESCLRENILRYFGEHTSGFCGNCCNCDAASETIDVTIPAQKFLSCVYRTEERADTDAICDILLGHATSEAVEKGWDKISTFGIMADSSAEFISALSAHLIRNQYLLVTESNGFALHLCAKAKNILFKHEKLSMKVRSSSQTDVRRQRAANHSADPELYGELFELRKKLASTKGIPPACLITDSAMQEICDTLPSTREELFAIKGIETSRLRFSYSKILVLTNKRKNQGEISSAL